VRGLRRTRGLVGRVVVRLLGRTGETILASAVFVASAGAAVVLHADLPSARRLAAAVTNRALADVFAGNVVLGDVEQLSLGSQSRVRVREVAVLTPEGERVLVARSVAATLDVSRLVGSLARGGPPEIALDAARVEHIDVRVDLDAASEPSLARAFAPKHPSPPPPPGSAPAQAKESVRLSVPVASIGHAHVHGNAVPPRLDADARDVTARVAIRDDVLTVDRGAAAVVLRSPTVPGMNGELTGRAEGSLVVPLGNGDVVMAWQLHGGVGKVPVTARLDMHGDRLEAALDVPKTSPEVVSSVFPFAPVTQPMRAHAEMKGTLPALGVSARIDVGDGNIDAKGTLRVDGAQPFAIDAELSRIDAAAVSGPKSAVSAKLHAEGELGGEAPRGTFRIDANEGTVAGVRTPAATASGSFDRRTARAVVHANEVGGEVDATLTADLGTQRIAFDATARSPDLRSFTRVPGLGSGSVVARARGSVDAARGTIVANVTLDGEHLEHGPVAAAEAHAEASVTGPLAAPVIDVHARGQKVTLTTPGKAPLTYPSATAHARVALAPAPRVTDAEVRIEGLPGGEAVVASASEIRVGGGGVEIRGARVTGIGAPLEVDARTSATGATTITARGEGVDMKRVASLTGIQELRLLPEGTRASLDVALRTDRTRADGHVDVVLVAEGGARAELHAVLDERHIRGRARVSAPGIGFVEVTRAELDLPGAPSMTTLPRATGSADVHGEIDLAQGASLFAPEGIQELAGLAIVTARLERSSETMMPLVRATVSTRALDVTLGDASTGAQGTHIGGVDAAVHVHYDGATDDAEVALLAWDGSGVLASADAKAKVPILAWARGEETFGRDALAAIDVRAVADLSRRNVADLPGIFARADLRGSVAAHAELTGPLAHPSVSLAARADDLRERQRTAGQPRYAPIDGALDATWDGEHVVAALRLDEAERRRAAAADPDAEDAPATKARPVKKSGHVRGLVLADLSAADLLAGRAPRWNASAEVDVEDLELAPLPLPMNARGALTARASVHDLAGAPSLALRATVADLGIAGARMKKGGLSVDAKSGALEAHARIEQEDGGNGTVDVQSTALVWRGTSVEWDAARATRIAYVVDRLRLAALRPIVRRSIPEIDGRVDGRGSATIDAGSQVFEGGIALSDGRFYVNAMGEEVSKVSAVARFEQSGVFRIQDATGQIGAGRFTASATGRMKGVRFEAAEAVVVIGSKDGIPLSSEGATFAEANGEVKLRAEMAPDRSALLVTVDVPRANIQVPDRNTQALQSLDPDETIAIGIRKSDGSLAPAPLVPPSTRAPDPVTGEKPLTARFTVGLGDEVLLEGRGLRVYLGGRTVVEIAQEVAVTGQINLKSGGTIDVQGRKFVVDRGTVTFDADDPANPTVIAAAYWDAPDRTRIWVEFSGPLKTGSLVLRSEPAYSKNEILSILLFGRPDPNMAKAGERQSGAQQAGALGAGVASAGLNKALGELSDDVDLEQDRTSANRVRTKVGYRLRRNLKVQLGYASGFSQREPDTTYLFLEWQFIPKWALIGTRGDRGTSILDVLFQHRY